MKLLFTRDGKIIFSIPVVYKFNYQRRYYLLITSDFFARGRITRLAFD